PSQDPDCWWTATGCTTSKLPGIHPDIINCPQPNTWGVNDGPNCTSAYPGGFYDFLKSKNQLASLYYIGSNVRDWPDTAIRGYSDGHHISVHTWSHPSMTWLSNTAVLAELYFTKKLIKQVLGVTPLYWRPPLGDIDDRVRAIAAQLNLTAMLWTADSFDWEMNDGQSNALTPAQVDANFQAVLSSQAAGNFSKSGVVVLEHELNNGTTGKAEFWYPTILKQFTHVVPFAACAGIVQPYAEANITFPTFASLTGTSGASPANASNPTAGASSATTTNAPASSVKKSGAIAGVAGISWAILIAAGFAGLACSL
ncbi:hypothetical protein BDK51DRAFT_18606, partial [Blyttiomyces helicus]